MLGLYWTFQFGLFKAKEHNARGIEFIEKCQYQNAINFFNDLLTQVDCVNDFEAHYYIGFCYKNLRQYNRALLEFNDALKIYKNIPSFIEIPSRITCHLKGLQPNSLGELYLWRGFSYMAMQNYEYAIANYTDSVNWGRNIIPIGPSGDGYQRYLRSVCYLALGQDFLAQKDITQLKADGYNEFLKPDSLPTKSNCYQIIQRSVR
jgi:tetratricopeptide (TPR) repeat protein